MIARALIIFIIFAAGAASSYFMFVPERDEAITRLVEHHRQKDADADAHFNQKEKENAENAEQMRNWYGRIIANLERDRVRVFPEVPRAGDDNQKGAADSGAEGANGSIEEPGFATFTKGRTLLERIENCKEDAAKLTALQLLLFKSGAKVE